MTRTRLLSFAIFIITLILLMPVYRVAEASSPATGLAAYNRNAAVKWALKNNYNDGRFWGDSTHSRWCTTYVTRAMQAGGIDVPVYTGNVQLALWLKAHPDAWQIRPVNKLEKGDIIFLNSKAEIPQDLGISWIDHIVLVTDRGKYSAWNAEWANRKFAKLSKWKYQLGIHFIVNGK